jgi:hypothetical protein
MKVSRFLNVRSGTSSFIGWMLIASMLIPINPVFAVVMGSSTYKIQSDTINFGGGIDSTSSSYKLGDTLGEIGTGPSSSSTYRVNAGFWQMQQTYISISSPSDVSLASISGLLGGSSEGTAAWLVTTDNIAGYNMTIKASTNPALQSGADSFADYAPATANPDYAFTNAASDSSFGFTPEGVDVATRFKDNGSACNTGSGETSSACWDGFSTTDKLIAERATGNHPSGTTTTVRFKAESGSSHIQTAGVYSATVTVTALAL